MPTGQAYELFRGLKDRGKTVELVFYPREGHGIAEYYHQKDRLHAHSGLGDALHARRRREDDARQMTSDRSESVTGSSPHECRQPGCSDTELLATLFELGREVTSVLDLDELLAEDPAAHRAAHAVQRVRRLPARRTPRTICASPTPSAIRRRSSRTSA